MKILNGTATFKGGNYTAALREARDVRRENRDKMMREAGRGAIYAGQQWTLLACDELGRTDNEVMEFYDKAPTKKEAVDLLRYAIEENPTLDKITISTYNNCYVYFDQYDFKNGNAEPWESGDERDVDLITWEKNGT